MRVKLSIMSAWRYLKEMVTDADDFQKMTREGIFRRATSHGIAFMRKAWGVPVEAVRFALLCI